MNINPRLIAFYALLNHEKEGHFVKNSLKKWQEKLSVSDYSFSQELCYGTVRMKSALLFLAKKLSNKKKLSLKVKERILLILSLYQLHFMQTPLYAVSSEMLKIVKKETHPSFHSFFSAILSNYDKQAPILPEETDTESLSIKFSFPELFVGKLKKNYGLEKTLSILESLNHPPSIEARFFDKKLIEELKLETIFESHPFYIAYIKEITDQLLKTPKVYIQNRTPIQLIDFLKDENFYPTKILDLCASPGGKTLAIHSLYPKAKLWVNDLNAEKMDRIQENFQKYQIESEYLIGRGEELETSEKFDLIILDVPCSNSGVLHKRCEARWRLDSTLLKSLEETQKKLLEKAQLLLKPEGKIWLLTCSILPQENEKIVQFAQEHLSLICAKSKLILPDMSGQDGGFCAKLEKI